MMRITLLIFLLWPTLAMATFEADSLAVETAAAGLAPEERLDFLQEEVRKTLRNALANLASIEDIVAAGQDPAARPETIDPAGFSAITEQISGH